MCGKTLTLKAVEVSSVLKISQML